MFSGDLRSVITSIVDSALTDGKKYKNVVRDDDGNITKNGILMEIDLHVETPRRGDEEQKRSWTKVYLLFCGNVSVFQALGVVDGEYRPVGRVRTENWENTSNHDSCWTSDGLNCLSDLYFDMCNEVDGTVAPITLDSYFRFGFSGAWKDVRITLKSHADDNGYDVIKVGRMPE